MSSEQLHEEGLSAETIDAHRAFVSLIEELEAVDWYNQRAEAATDPELKQILAHNRDEEKEHAMMVLEWLRRRDAKLTEMIGTYVNSTGSIVAAETAATGEVGDGGGAGDSAATPADGSLGIGDLRGK